MTNLRIGHGYDVHRLTERRRLVLGGVEIPWDCGLLGHSDADVRKGRARGTSFFQGSRSSSATAWAAIPEPSPVKPRCSSVVAFTFTRSASVPRAAERFASISGR